MFVWDGWGRPPKSKTLWFQTSKMKTRLNLIQFCTQVSERDLAGWRALVPQRSSGVLVCQAGLKIIDFASVRGLTGCVCMCVCVYVCVFEAGAGTRSWNASSCCCKSYGVFRRHVWTTSSDFSWSRFRFPKSLETSFAVGQRSFLTNFHPHTVCNVIGGFHIALPVPFLPFHFHLPAVYLPSFIHIFGIK